MSDINSNFDPRKIKVFYPSSTFVMVSTKTGKIIQSSFSGFIEGDMDESIQNFVPVRYSGMVDKLGNMILDGDILTGGLVVFYDTNHGAWRCGQTTEYAGSDPLWTFLEFCSLKFRSWGVGEDD